MPVEYLGLGCPWICASDGPSTPFAGPYLAVMDTIRVAALVVALIVIWLSLVEMWSARTKAPQASRYLALGAFALAAALTEVEHLGDIANYRLWINLLASVAGLFGCWRRRDPGDTR